ncbi:MAG TPA: hypothetical protein VFZ61_25090 [Polyangiales bacterium]
MSALPLAPTPGPLNQVDAGALAAEHARLARYVAGVEATPYQRAKYVDFHRKRAVEPRGKFDHILVGLSHLGAVGLMLADAYSGTFYRASLVRVKLMLTLAILECSPPSYVVLDAPDPGGSLVFVRMLVRVVLAALALATVAVVLVPLHILYAVFGGARAK